MCAYKGGFGSVVRLPFVTVVDVFVLNSIDPMPLPFSFYSALLTSKASSFPLRTGIMATCINLTVVKPKTKGQKCRPPPPNVTVAYLAYNPREEAIFRSAFDAINSRELSRFVITLLASLTMSRCGLPLRLPSARCPFQPHTRARTCMSCPICTRAAFEDL